MSFEEIINRILSSRSDLTREDILRMVEEKEKSAKGYLTHESAARALATELGVKVSKIKFKPEILISDLASGLGDVTVTGRVIFIYPLQRFIRQDETKGMVRHLLIADKSGAIKVVLWDEKADLQGLEETTGRIVRFSHGYVRRGLDGKLELNLGSRGEVQIQPQDISDDEYPPLTLYTKGIGEITGKEGSVKVIGAVELINPIATFKRQDGKEGKVRRIELRDKSGQMTVVLWNEKVDEIGDIKRGTYLELIDSKVKERPDGHLELHVENSTYIRVLAEKPVDLESPPTRLVKIKDLKPRMDGISVLARVLHKGKAKEYKASSGETGYVLTLLIGDETRSIRLSLWDDKTHLSEQIKVGDILLVKRAYAREKFGRLSLNLDAEGSLTLNPETTKAEALPPYEEKITKVSGIKEGDELVTVEGTVATIPIIKEVTTSRNERIRLAFFELKDETGRIEVYLWRELANPAEHLSLNDKVRIKNLYVNRDLSGRLRLSSGIFTSLNKT